MADRKKLFYPRTLADDLPDDLLPADFFVIPAVDDKGHSRRMQFRGSAELERQVEEIVTSKQYPFRTRGDLMRFAVFETCRRLLRYSHDVPDIMGELEIVNVMVRRKERKAAFEDTIRKLQETIDDLQKANADGEIVELLKQIHHQIEHMTTVDSYWGERCREEVERRWGALYRELEAKLAKNVKYIHWGDEMRKHRNGEGS